MQAMVLAAGFGTRLRPYTLIRPKPLFPVCNRPLLQIVLRQLQALGCGRIVVNCHHLAQAIEQAVQGFPEVVVQKEELILGTGGGLRQALELFDSQPVLVVNGDIFHTVDLTALYRHHRRSGNLVTMALHRLPRFSGVAVEGDRVIGFHPDGNRDCLAFTGIHVVDPEVIARIPAGRFFHIIDLYARLARQGGIGFVRVDGSFWCDIGTPEDYLALHGQILHQGQGPDWLRPTAGTWCVHPESDLSSDVRLLGWGAVGAGSQVLSGAVLECCVVWDGVRVEAGRYHHRILTGCDDPGPRSS